MSTEKLTNITFHYISNRISICDTLMLVLQTNTILPMLVLLPIIFVIDHLKLFQVFVVSPGSSGRPLPCTFLKMYDSKASRNSRHIVTRCSTSSDYILPITIVSTASELLI